MLFKIISCNQCSHAVTEKIYRQIFVLVLYICRDSVKVIGEIIKIACIKITEVGIGFYASAVSPVVMNYAYKAAAAEIPHKFKVSFLVLRHAVRKLHCRTRLYIRFWFCYGYIKRQSVAVRSYHVCYNHFCTSVRNVRH